MNTSNDVIIGFVSPWCLKVRDCGPPPFFSLHYKSPAPSNPTYGVTSANPGRSPFSHFVSTLPPLPSNSAVDRHVCSCFRHISPHGGRIFDTLLCVPPGGSPFQFFPVPSPHPHPVVRASRAVGVHSPMRRPRGFASLYSAGFRVLLPRSTHACTAATSKVFFVRWSACLPEILPSPLNLLFRRFPRPQTIFRSNGTKSQSSPEAAGNRPFDLSAFAGVLAAMSGGLFFFFHHLTGAAP